MLSRNMASSVGYKSANKPNDVKLILALLNSYARKEKIFPLIPSVIVSDEYIRLIKIFQKKIIKMGKPDGVVSANLGTFKGLVRYLESCYTVTSITKPIDGDLTWEAEGQEGGLYHSRKFHIPSINSGLTIGRGYDMKDKNAVQIKSDFIKSGIDAATSTIISKVAGKKGNQAELFIIDNDLLDFEISATAQLKLFNIIYKKLEDDVKRICSKSDTVLEYGEVDWDNLDKVIKTVLIDLRYRGDYTSSSRMKIQQHVSNNDLIKFKEVINETANWVGVPDLRRKQRITYLAKSPN